jgi:hypothetical protein
MDKGPTVAKDFQYGMQAPGPTAIALRSCRPRRKKSSTPGVLCVRVLLERRMAEIDAPERPTAPTRCRSVLDIYATVVDGYVANPQPGRQLPDCRQK